MPLFNLKNPVGLSQNRMKLYCAAGVLALLSLFQYGCNKNTSQNKALTQREIAGRASADAVKRVKAKASSSHVSNLFDKMDASLYRGETDKYGDVIMNDRTAENNINPVVFSHRTHRDRYTCRVCHLELEFSMKKGDSGVTREDYLDGRYCGACHDGTVAFSVTRQGDCNRCHIPIDGKGQYRSKKNVAGRMSDQSFGDGVDWMELLRSGNISPKTSLLDGENSSTMALPPNLSDDKLRWTTKTPSYPVSVAVWFPHEAHVKWLDCANCHPDIFTVKQNATVDFDKSHILAGDYCGACHLSVAFPMDGCRRCHPDKKQKK